MLAERNTYMEDTVVTFHEMTADEKIREQCEAREKYNWDMAAATHKGIQEGIQKGIQKGSDLKLISLVCRKLEKGKTAEVIADELDEKLEIVERICKTAVKFAPEYNAEKIYTAL